ncbi:amidohydrolase family protein [Vineibacter terrae]|uniref:amidohydrolase family protein n=1 Tax=Vineibacter terrae TaxID=2586908 RepID=UPI002E356018|nr:amidohydrolase family protein [Vineibacter terrae]HEX2891237.1 amidohydrolase family protein [Vineibacter terrae]
MSSPEKIIIRGGRLIDANSHVAAPTDILVIGDSIAELGPPGMPAPSDARQMDASARLMHPGLINAHTHGMGNISKGAADRWSLELLWVGAPSFMANQSLEHKYLNTYLGAVEMLLKGCTAAYDLTFGHPAASVEEISAVGQAYVDAGMRAVVAPMLADLSFYQAIPGLLDALPERLRRAVAAYDEGPHEGTLQMMRASLHGWKHDREQVRLGVAPIIPLHCSDALISGAARLAREHGVVLHSHVAESKVQAVSALKRYGKTLTAHIDGLGLLGPDFTVAHGVWLDDDDMRRLADHGCSVAHNPASNMRLGSGIANARRLIELGVNLGIGTDSANCSDNLNMYEAMHCASMVSNVQGPDFTRWLRSEEVLNAATIGSARALGFDKIGRIAPGYKADIVFLNLQKVNWIPVNDATNQVVLTEDGTSVDAVMVGGRMVVERGCKIGCDMAKLARDAEVARAHLATLNEEARALGAQLEGVVGSFCIGLSNAPYHIHRYGHAH